MGRHARVALYVLALVALVVGVDVLFFRHRLWERLMVNVGIVLVFAAFYLRFLKRSMSAAVARLRAAHSHTPHSFGRALCGRSAENVAPEPSRR